MKTYYKNKRYRVKNGHLIAPASYFVRAMCFWAKDSFEAHKKLKESLRLIKELQAEIADLKNAI